ncbi:hypothetical protein LHJ74_22100 [Streptomyces sp. N2-109]|uniref:Uncharacterized protein n=1 Tax=Streptomyces gossypii TaxID=2883101 RepID=A0ABT2JXD8_9ACTN|nr:hypothetical protein [Streptomyces gossypii]MCT2592567.1 hypothetical protein [Streptomyces gossypii]
MRVNKTTSLALAASLALGGAGAATAAFAAAPEPVSPSVQTPAPLPGTGEIVTQNELLGDTSAALRPVNELVTAVLQSPQGKLQQAEAERHTAAVRTAIDDVRKAAIAGGTAHRAAPAPAGAPADLIAKAADQLQKQAEALVEVSAPADKTTPGQRTPELKKVRAELKSTMSASVDFLTAVVFSGQLPTPGLEGLPELPDISEAPQQQDQQQAQQQAPDAAQNSGIAGLPG